MKQTEGMCWRVAWHPTGSKGCYGRLAAVLALTAACADADPAEGTPFDEATPDNSGGEMAGGAVAGGDVAEDVDSSPAEDPAETTVEDLGGGCRAPSGVDDSPETIPELLTLINALPRPTSVACFVESLARPLYAYATMSALSAQPAGGATDPRMFLFLGESLIVSVVSASVSEDMLEYSFLTGPTRSVKGEIPFPLHEDVTTDDIVAHIGYRESSSICLLCHADETPAGEGFYEGALESRALRPFPIYDISLESVRVEAALCDVEATPKRCANLSALFDHGDVFFKPFPEEMPVFF